MNLNPFSVGYYGATNQQLIGLAARERERMLDRWRSDPQRGLVDDVKGLSPRARYIEHMAASARTAPA